MKNMRNPVSRQSLAQTVSVCLLLSAFLSVMPGLNAALADPILKN